MLNPYEGGKFRVTSLYGMRSGQFHAGLDVVGESSKKLLALCNGTIIQSRIVPKGTGDLTWQWGNYVCLKADTGELIFYCHLSKRLVTQGQRVKKGDVIGIEGNTGYSFGSHCHLEIRSAENKVTASVNTPKFTGIPNKVGTYIVEKKEDEPMTAAEKKEFEALQTEVAEIKSELAKKENCERVYHYWDELPEWAHEPIMAMYKKGYFAGAAPDNLDLPYNTMRVLVIVARALKADGKLDF